MAWSLHRQYRISSRQSQLSTPTACPGWPMEHAVPKGREAVTGTNWSSLRMVPNLDVGRGPRGSCLRGAAPRTSWKYTARTHACIKI